MASKKDNQYQHAEIIINNMIKKSGLSQNKFSEEVLGIKSVNISKARHSGRIPDRWFQIMQEKFGVTKEELCESPDIELPINEGRRAAGESLSHPQEPKDVFDQVMDNFFEMVKNWQAEENDRSINTAIKFTQEFALTFPEFMDWQKKRGRGGDKGRLQEPVRNVG